MAKHTYILYAKAFVEVDAETSSDAFRYLMDCFEKNEIPETTWALYGCDWVKTEIF